MQLMRIAVLFLACVACSLSGCGSSIQPVSGEIVYPDGSPARELKGSRVIFEVISADGKGYSAEGEIDGDGKFVLNTDKPGDGAFLGKSRVLIERRMLDPERAAPRVILEKYERFETSGLEYEVIEGSNHPKFTVEPIKKR